MDRPAVPAPARPARWPADVCFRPQTDESYWSRVPKTIEVTMNHALSRFTQRIASGSCAAVLAAAGSLFAAVAMPASAQAAPTLTCTITPGGTPSTTNCGTSVVNTAYNANFVVTGLPSGTYSYAWTATGALPQPISCSGSICNQALDADHQDVREKVQVVATNTATNATYTLSVRVGLFAVCGAYLC